jgi:uncharacterized protein
MSNTIVDAFAFCRLGEQRAGVTPVAGLARLAAEAAKPEGEIRWSFQGGRHPSGYPQLNMAVEGEMSLVCQRCLLPFSYGFDAQSVLVLASDDADADATEEALDDESVDVIVGSAALDLLQLVEDEVLLSIPLSPRHPQCPDGGSVPTPEKPDSPFAVLHKLKK